MPIALPLTSNHPRLISSPSSTSRDPNSSPNITTIPLSNGSGRARTRAVRVKCSPDDTVGDLKKLIAAQTGTDASKIQLKKWCVPPAWPGALRSVASPSHGSDLGTESSIVQVYNLQGPHHAWGLRDQRWNESRDVLGGRDGGAPGFVVTPLHIPLRISVKNPRTRFLRFGMG